MPLWVSAQQPDSSSSVSYRLPNTTHPISYDVSWLSRVDLNEFDFSGHVKIEIVVDVDTREIVLHSKQLKLTNINLKKLLPSDFVDLPLQPLTYDTGREFVYIRTDGPLLRTGDHLSLEISFVGTLRTDNGFYRTSYVANDGTLRQAIKPLISNDVT